MERKHRAGWLVLLYFLLETSASYAAVNTAVRLNTTRLMGHPAGPFSIVFQITDGSIIGDRNNTVVLSNFQFAGGSAAGSPTVFGGATGNLSSTITLTDSEYLNVFIEQFVPGSEFSFTVSSTTNVDAGQVADQFSFSIMDNTGAAIPTMTGILYFDAFALLKIDSSNPSLQTYALDPGRAPAGGGNPIGTSTTNAIFPQVAFGGSAASGGPVLQSIFTLLNTGSDPLSGNLILTGQDGNPLNAILSSEQTSVVGSSISVSLKPGQTTSIRAESADPSDPKTNIGWGRVDSSGGVLSGVATYYGTWGGTLKTVVGVLSCNLVSVATIPVDDDASNGRWTGYAIANTGSANITVSVREVSADTNTVTALTDIVLAPGQQKAAFFWQDPKASQNQKFKGSAVLIGKNGAGFAIVALLDNGEIYSAIPVVQAKASIIN